MIDAHTHLENGDLSVDMFVSLLMLPKKKELLIFRF